MTWFNLTGDARLGHCDTEGCGGQPTWRLETCGIGSNYCSGCKEIIASPTPRSEVRTVDALRKQAFELSRDDQYRLAFFIAEHIGFGLARCTCGGGIDQPASEHDVSCPAALGAAQAGLDPVTVEACAKHIEHEADVATNSLHCGDNSATIAATHRVSRAYHEAAKSIRALSLPSADREGK